MVEIKDRDLIINQDQLKRVLLSASTFVEYETIIPIIEELMSHNIGWFFIYDDLNQFNTFSKTLDENNCCYIFNCEIFDKISRFDFIAYCSAHEGSLLTITLTALMHSMGIPVYYIPHGLIFIEEPQLYSKIKLYKNNSLSVVYKYLLYWIKMNSLFWIVSKKILPLISKRYSNEWSYALVSDPDVKHALLNKGVADSKIIVTGNPRFERLIINYSNAETSNLTKKSIGEKLIKILYISQSFVEDNIIGISDWNALMKSIVQLLEKSSIFITIRPHPREDVLKFNKYLINDRIIIDENSSLGSAIQSSDILITVNSTTALEAKCLGVPVISINCDKISKQTRNNFPSDIPIAHSVQELFLQIEDVLNKKNYYTNNNSYSENQIGSCRRIVDIIIGKSVS